jgi:hypothetical protein
MLQLREQKQVSYLSFNEPHEAGLFSAVTERRGRTESAESNDK